MGECVSLFCEKETTVMITPPVEHPINQLTREQKKSSLLSSSVFSFNKQKSELVASEKRMNCDMLSKFEIKENFYFDSYQTCMDYIYLDTFYSLCQNKKFSIEQSKEDFLKFCREKGRKYASSTFDDDFMNLETDIRTGSIESNENAISWYLKNSFLCRLISSTFETFDYSDIFKLRYIIGLLNDQLYSIKQKPIGEVYRGIEMNKDDFAIFQEKLHMPFLFRGYISTSSKYEEAIKLFERKKPNENKCPLILTISAENSNQHLLHLMSNFSKYPDENEVLLNCLSMIEAVDIKLKDDRYKVECSFVDSRECKSLLCNTNTLEYFEKCKGIKNFMYPNDKFFLFRILYIMRKYDKCCTVLQEIPNENDECQALKYIYAGMTYQAQGENDLALKYFLDGLDITLKTKRDNEPELADIYNSIGDLYKDNAEKAASFYQKALKCQK